MKNLSLAEDYFADHFPGYPVDAGAADPRRAGPDRRHPGRRGQRLPARRWSWPRSRTARFHREALAGEQLIYDVEILHLRPEGASVAGPRCSSAATSVDRPRPRSSSPTSTRSRSQQLFGDHNFVFSGELKHLLGLAKRRRRARTMTATRVTGDRAHRGHGLCHLCLSLITLRCASWLLPPVASSSPASASSLRSGWTPAAFWDGLRQAAAASGRSAPSTPPPCRRAFAGEIAGFDAKNYIDKKDRKSLQVMARRSSSPSPPPSCALDDGKVDKSKLDPTRFGVEFGSGLIATRAGRARRGRPGQRQRPAGHVDLEKWGEQGLPHIPPLWMLKYLPNMLACHVSILHNAQGPNNSITESDVAGLLALGEAYRILAPRPGRLLPRRRRPRARSTR